MPDIDYSRLCRAVTNARLVLRKPREERVRMVREYVGLHWSEEGARKTVPCNMVGAYVGIVSRKLIANNPKVMLRTFNRKARPTVSAMEFWVNQEIKKINLQNTIERAVVDALFNIGVIKVGLATPSDSASLNWQIRAGEPFAVCVDFDDWVYDVHARDFSQASFMGHRVRWPLRAAQKMFGRTELTPSDDPPYNQQGDERTSILGRTLLAGGSDMEFEDMVDLWEIYLPRENKIVMLADDQITGASTKGGEKPLSVKPWLGPARGPYHFLGMQIVPNNAMPKAPLQDLIDLHDALNMILRKLIRQAERQKDILAVAGGADADGNRILKANDGEATRVDNPANMVTMRFGGADPNNLQIFGVLKELLSWLAGNLELMGGLGPQSRTASQDQLLNQNASATIGQMIDRTVTLTRDVTESLCWFWHHDPVRVHNAVFSPKGLPEIEVPRPVYPGSYQGKGLKREHAFEDMQLTVDPYSLGSITPQQRLATLQQIIGQTIIPLMPILGQYGIRFDPRVYMEKVAEYTNEPDLTEILSLGEPVGMGEGQTPPTTPKAAETTRNYVRRSESGATSGGKDLTAVNMMRTNQNNGAPT